MKVYRSIILILLCAGFGFGQPGKKIPDAATPTVAEIANLSAADRNKAVELYTQEDYKAAIPLFDKVLTADKTDYEGWLYFAMSLLKTGDSKDAAEAFGRAQNIRRKNKPNPADKAEDTHGFKITAKPHAPFTDEGRGITGIVYIAIEFRADGKLGMIVPLNSLPGGLTRSAYLAAREIKFNPYVKDGKPLTVIKVIEYSFRTE